MVGPTRMVNLVALDTGRIVDVDLPALVALEDPRRSGSGVRRRRYQNKELSPAARDVQHPRPNAAPSAFGQLDHAGRGPRKETSRAPAVGRHLEGVLADPSPVPNDFAHVPSIDGVPYDASKGGRIGASGPCPRKPIPVSYADRSTYVRANPFPSSLSPEPSQFTTNTLPCKWSENTIRLPVGVMSGLA